MQIWEILTNSTLLLFLGGAAWMDYRKKELPLFYIAGGFLLGILFRILSGADILTEILPGFLPGLACLLLAKLTREAIGYGDALMMIAAGAFCAMPVLLFLLLGGFLTASLCSVLLLILKKRKRKETIPFMPFLLCGYVLTLAIL